MEGSRFEALARELAERDRALAAPLATARSAAVELRRHAEHAVATFCAAARAQGAEHLTELRVGPVEPDEKHVDCIQLRIARGRHELVCVADSGGRMTLVGPFRRGKQEGPCADFPLRGPELLAGFDERLEALIRTASER
jgi:hypothetical protein